MVCTMTSGGGPPQRQMRETRSARQAARSSSQEGLDGSGGRRLARAPGAGLARGRGGGRSQSGMAMPTRRQSGRRRRASVGQVCT